MSAPARRGECLWTYSGRRFWPLDPRPEDVAIEDIAHALSMQCRFAGHVREFYSVAQHSWLVSWLCDERDAMWGLLHDAAEAYVVDLLAPLKRALPLRSGWRAIERCVEAAVCGAFGLPLMMPPSVVRADDYVLGAELRDLMRVPAGEPLTEFCAQGTIEPLAPSAAEELFLRRFWALVEGEREVAP